MKKIFVNEEACIGCGACVAIDGEHFDFNDDGLSEVISNENIDSENAKNAISSCPTNAINYIEEENDDCECEDCHCGKECECHQDNECNCEHCNCD